MTQPLANLNALHEISPRVPNTSDWPQENVQREIQPMPDRYRNPIGKYRINRLAGCISCGRCAEVCSYGVHVKPEGYALMLRPQDHQCVGPACSDSSRNCLSQCPQKALTMQLNPNVECLGDSRRRV